MSRGKRASVKAGEAQAASASERCWRCGLPGGLRAWHDVDDCLAALAARVAALEDRARHVQ